MMAMIRGTKMKISFHFPPSVPEVKKRLQKYSREMSDTSRETYTKLVDPNYSSSSGMVDPNYRLSSGMVDPNYRLSSGMVDPNYRLSSRMGDPHYRLSSRMGDPHYRQSKTWDESDNRSRCIYLPTVELPGKDDLNMLGFECVRSQCGYIPPATNTARRKQQRQWLRETAMNVLEENKTHQILLSALSVTWQLKPTLPGYNSSYLHHLFSKHGKVEELWMTSPNSAMVVFKELSVACNVVNLRFLGKYPNRLQFRFYLRDMENKQVEARQRRA